MISMMLKFKGKPSELQEVTSKLCEYYGAKQNILAVYIMLDKETDGRSLVC